MIELTDEMRDAVKGRMGIPRDDRLDPWMEAALQDVLALVERERNAEIDRLRSELEVTRAVARSNKRHVALVAATLGKVEALLHDTDGGEIDPDADIPIGEIRRALYEPIPTSQDRRF